MDQKNFVWENREEYLKKVIRFHDPNHKFDVMYYRTNLQVHTKREGGILESLIPITQKYYPNLDPHRVRVTAKYHDDPEMVSKRGDVSLQLKLSMSNEEKAILKNEEIEAIQKISTFCPKKVEGYSYEGILLDALHKESREAQLHSFADKWDGCCEALHEVFAGNMVFLEPVLNYYQVIFSNRAERFPLIKNLFNSEAVNHSPFLQFPVLDLMELFSNGNRRVMPHTPLTISLNSGIPSYEAWKEITLKTFPNGMDLLINQTEFHQ